MRDLGAFRAPEAAARPPLLVAVVLAAALSPPAPARADLGPAAGAKDEQVVEGGLRAGWQYWGWGQAPFTAGAPLTVRLGGQRGLILARPDLAQRDPRTFSTLTFRLRAPAGWATALSVHLRAANAQDFPHVAISAPMCTEAGGGWVSVAVPLSRLNPAAAAFDRIIFAAPHGPPVGAGADDALSLDQVRLVAAGPAALAPKPARRLEGRLTIDARARRHQVSPLIFGTAFNAQKRNDPAAWASGTSIRRWGGNNTSRYNWRLGHAWNTASDWFFMNVNYTNDATYSWTTFLDDNRAHGVKSVVSVPTIGWVAKDTESYSFPVSAFGQQQSANGDVGNGLTPKGDKIEPGPPTRTSVPMPPADVGAWVRAMREHDRRGGKRNLFGYILDNEPALWNSTHRDVHPEAVTYDELLRRLRAYGAEVRRNDPEAVISGPAEWGWPGYFFSARDQEVGFGLKPDRRAHGDRPLTEWLLDHLFADAQKTGVRVLDQLDFHYYPQTDGVYGRGERTDGPGAKARWEATRSLWDPDHVDASWINDRIRLLPRMQELIDRHHPGLGISIGEYNFGGEGHISGGLAQAEALGRFAEHRVRSAYLWTYPAENSFSRAAFLAYRDYDGKGARFLDNFVPARVTAPLSAFVSANDAGDRMVAVLINPDPDVEVDVDVALAGGGAVGIGRTFSLTESAPRLVPGGATSRPRVPPRAALVVELAPGRAGH